MTESEFEQLAEKALVRIEESLEESGAEVDIESGADGVLELEFEDGTKMIVNRHSAAREIWVAAKSGGFHFRWDGNVWRDSRDGSELFAALSKLVSSQSGKGVVLKP